VNGDSRGTNERGPSWGWFVGLLVPVQGVETVGCAGRNLKFGKNLKFVPSLLTMIELSLYLHNKCFSHCTIHRKVFKVLKDYLQTLNLLESFGSI
jgi:hypothetical protein